MATNLKSDYQLKYARYRHYYRQVWKLYKKPSAQVSTALLLTIFTIIFFALFAIRPTLVTVAELIKTIDDQEEVLAKLKRKAAALATAQQEYSLNETSIQKLNQAIPEDKNIQELVTLVETTAADHRLVLDSISINEFEYTADQSLPDFVAIPFSLSLTAEYVELKDFLHDLVRLPRFIGVDSIAFSQDEEVEDSLSPENIQLSVQVNAYYAPNQIE